MLKERGKRVAEQRQRLVDGLQRAAVLGHVLYQAGVHLAQLFELFALLLERVVDRLGPPKQLVLLRSAAQSVTDRHNPRSLATTTQSK